MANAFNILTLLGALLTAVLYWFGLENSLFWYYPWYDIPMHIIGGITIGLWACAIAAKRGFSLRQMLIFGFLLVIAIGCIWEIFEYVSGLSREPGYWFDTIKDIFDDIFGMLVAAFLYWRSRVYIKNKNNVADF